MLRFVQLMYKPALAYAQEYVGMFLDTWIYLSNQLIVEPVGFEPTKPKRQIYSLLVLTTHPRLQLKMFYS